MENVNSFKKFVIFILPVLAFLFLANFIIYNALLVVFNISGNSLLLIGILGILLISFFASMILGMNFYNLFSRTYYLISMLWMGFIGLIFIASVLYIFAFIYGLDISRLFLIITFCIVSMIILYGVFQASKFKVKIIDIKLHNLSSEWQNKKLSWISDLHIGQVHGIKYVQKIVDELKLINPDILFIGGDLFDGSSTPKILDCISPFSKLHISRGIYFITGNHEYYGKSQIFLNRIQEVGIKILNDEKILIDDLQIIGVDYKSSAKKSDFLKILTDLEINTEMPSILLKHEPKYIKIAEKMGITFQISGHTHRAQQWPFEYLTRVIYGRFAYGLKKIKNMQVYTSSGVGTWGPPVRIGTNNEIVVFNLN